MWVFLCLFCILVKGKKWWGGIELILWAMEIEMKWYSYLLSATILTNTNGNITAHTDNDLKCYYHHIKMSTDIHNKHSTLSRPASHTSYNVLSLLSHVQGVWPALVFGLYLNIGCIVPSSIIIHFHIYISIVNLQSRKAISVRKRMEKVSFVGITRSEQSCNAFLLVHILSLYPIGSR